MSISGYLDVFIGLAFIYLILSLIVSVAFESIAQFTRLRARSLKRAIRKLLEEERTEAGSASALVEKFYDHPMIKSLSREKDTGRNDISDTGGWKSIWKHVRQFLRSVPHFSYVRSNTFATVAISVLFPGEDLAAKDDKALESLVNTLPESKIKGVLLTHLKCGQKSLKSLTDGVENWFNDTMERLSGWFTRTARWVSLVIGLIVAVGLNVDTFVVANALWREPALRAGVAEYISENYSRYLPDEGPGSARIDNLRTELSSLELPIGWDTYGPDPTVVAESSGRFGAAWTIATRWAPQHLLGWLFTALAVSLGAHFWFDLLGRFITVRAAGKSLAGESARNKPRSA